MDTTTFLSRSADLFVADGATTTPRDPYWQQIADSVSGYTSAHELAVLGLAAGLLPESECYVEVGTFKGRSICAAVRDAAGQQLYAIENFLEFGMTGQEARAELEHNLATYAADANVVLREGDFFEIARGTKPFDQPVGVYFYDGEHTLLAHYLALAAIEPFLADEALVLIDDATWPVVQRAHRWFLRSHPGWSIEACWDATEPDDPQWANGLHALVFRRARPSRLSRRDALLLRYQATGQATVNSAAWAVADRFPRITKAVAGAVLSRSRTIGGDRT
ncbi:class I SAM-dependent methyltransferase [Demetria terragena]|uniref:class I SAM-dependent methyltransferase n=1 Tax=Demetria terragena TaxID=63959 RepID=UPI0003791CAD|nr:class I SAM-dependent methyltransferase [Demetria terragena]